jgi:hypothetical protein
MQPRQPRRDTIRDLPSNRSTERRELGRAVLYAVSSGKAPEGFRLFARCGQCDAHVTGWQNHVGEAMDFDPSAAAILLSYSDACLVCGGSDVWLLAERADEAGA